MSTQKLTAFEQAVLAGLSHKPSIAASLLDAWANMPQDSVLSARSLVDVAQLGVTEETASTEFLERSIKLGLAEITPSGFRARATSHSQFRRLAFALNTIEHYRSTIHRDDTVAQVVLTKPPKPSVLEQKLSELGWRTNDLEQTQHAFDGIVRSAKSRVVVMTPFFDNTGAKWLLELLSNLAPGVNFSLILRSLEDPNRNDHPTGFAAISSILKQKEASVFNYSLARQGGGRETFHAKVVLCDRNIAYIGSSNLNFASLEHSMEMGAVFEGKAAAKVSEVIDAVISASTRWL